MNITVNGTPFQILPEEIGAKSLSKSEITLHYSGDVPVQSQDDVVLLSQIHFIVRRPFQPLAVQLVVRSMHSGMSLQKRYAVSCTSDEIISVLDRFFADPNSGTSGMEPYWEGFSQASYIAWKQAVKEGSGSGLSFASSF